MIKPLHIPSLQYTIDIDKKNIDLPNSIMLPKVFLAFLFFCFAHTTNHPFKTVGICDDFMGTRSEIAKETRINLRKTKTKGIDCEIADLPTVS